MKKFMITLSMLVLAVMARGTVLFEEIFDVPDGTTVGWYGAKWAVTNGAAVRTGDDTGDLRAIMNATGDLSNGYVFSWDWKTDTTDTHANP